MKRIIVFVLLIFLPCFGQWYKVNLPIELPYWSVNDFEFIDNNVGFVTAKGAILKTIDSGENWEETEIITLSGKSEELGFSYIKFIGDIGFCLGNKAFITKDKGDSWQEINAIGLGAHKCFFTQNDTIWSCGRRAKVYKSVDSGLTWETVEFESPVNWFSAGLFIDANNGVLGGQTAWNPCESEIAQTAYTHNGGKDWISHEPGPGACGSTIEDLCCTKDNIVYGAGRGWSIAKSADMGDTWEDIWLPQTESLGMDKMFSTICVDPLNRIWVSDINGNLIVTNDDFETFTFDSSGCVYARKIRYNNSKMWIIGSNGLFYKNLDLRSTGNLFEKHFVLKQNYPNPFNPITTIEFSLEKSATVKIDVYNANGRLVQHVKDGWMDLGDHQIEFNGSGLPSGLYFYNISSGQFSETKKMVLLK